MSFKNSTLSKIKRKDKIFFFTGREEFGSIILRRVRRRKTPNAERPANWRPAQNFGQFAIVRTTLNYGFYLMVFTLKVTGIIFNKLF